MSQSLVSNDLPIEAGDRQKLVIEIAARILLGSVAENGTFAIYPDEAVRLASVMVGYAISDEVTQRTMSAYMNPTSVAASIDEQMSVVLERAKQLEAGTTARNAAAYAKAFGLKPA